MPQAINDVNRQGKLCQPHMNPAGLGLRLRAGASPSVIGKFYGDKQGDHGVGYEDGGAQAQEYG